MTVESKQSRITETDTDVSIKWLAGHFVGEGSISVSITDSNPYKCGIPRVKFALIVRTTVREEVEAYKDYFGLGKVREEGRRKENWSPTYVWECQAQDSVIVLEHLISHLHRGPKVRQAELALELLRGIDFRTHRYAVSEEEARRRVALANQIRELTQ